MTILTSINLYFQKDGFDESRHLFRSGLDFKNTLIVPLNENSVHWTTCFIDPVAFAIDYYDSQHSDGSSIMASILDFIEKERKFSKLPFNRSIWKLRSHFDTPKQSDTFSCGVLSIQTALCIGLGRKIDFEMDSVAEIRKKIKFLLALESITDPYVYDIN